MKRIEAIVSRSHMLGVLSALEGVGVHFTHSDTKGHGRTSATKVGIQRGTATVTEEFNVNLTIVTVVPDSMVDNVVEKILYAAGGSEGKIFVYDVFDAIDIRTKSRGDSIL